MNDRASWLKTALAGILALGAAQAALAHDGDASREKCYGIAKAGQNDCGTARHTCAGKATSSNSPDDWKYVASGSCQKLGGRTSAGGAGTKPPK
ncbi:MAG TPA: DUF2282 domain-containing protein [Usitatibacter sp.]|jgi:uncharacterized membrane protein|nr:DUF2282 domain-containing protein [Usitatibacter sp.]